MRRQPPDTAASSAECQCSTATAVRLCLLKSAGVSEAHNGMAFYGASASTLHTATLHHVVASSQQLASATAPSITAFHVTDSKQARSTEGTHLRSVLQSLMGGSTAPPRLLCDTSKLVQEPRLANQSVGLRIVGMRWLYAQLLHI